MKKIARVLALALLAVGTYSAATQPPSTVATMFGAGGPIPICDPSVPTCKLEPANK